MLTSLHDRLNRILHFDVNVTDLERSRAWYEAVSPLRVVSETRCDQVFPSLGLASGAFRGYLMRDATQVGEYPMIHLVQWLDPAPAGRPYEHHSQVGWYRIVSVATDIHAVRAAVQAAGSEPIAETTDRQQQFHAGVPAERYRVFAARDPDGIAVEFSAADARPARTPIVVAHNTADAERFLPFYTHTLGLEFMQGLQVPGPMPNVYSPGGGTTQHDGALMALRGDRRVMFDWLQWAPRVPGTAYAEPSHVGIMRCALEVDDLRASYAALAGSEWHRSGQITVHEPETWDLGPAGELEVVTFTDPEGVGFQLVQQPPWPNATLDSFHVRATYDA